MIREKRDGEVKVEGKRGSERRSTDVETGHLGECYRGE
jgi:hypothetical protein